MKKLLLLLFISVLLQGCADRRDHSRRARSTRFCVPIGRQYRNH